MYIYFQKVKYLLATVLTVSIAWGAIQLNSVVYDLIVNIDDTNVVQDFNPEGGLTYYEPLVFTTTTGGDFEFNNYSSKLTNNVTDTSLLIYDNLQANLIVDEPWAFNDGAGIGFGGGQENTFQGFDRESQAFQGTITLAGDNHDARNRLCCTSITRRRTNPMTIDITQQLNYSQAVRRARPEWDDDKVRRAAEYLVLYMDVRLKPYKVNEKLNEFDKDGGFLF